MTFKSVARVARLIGFVVSPLLTAPAAAVELEREPLAALVRGEGPAALYACDPAGRATPAGRGWRRVSL